MHLTAASHSLRTARQILAGTLARSRAALQYRDSQRRGTQWSGTIERVVADLEQLNRSTEREFLAAGEKLASFLAVARQISSHMAELTGLVSGDHGRHASQALQRMLEQAQEMDDRIRQNGEVLASICDFANRIRVAFGKVGETVAVFRTLCTLTRIETSRLGGAASGFHDLADEVKPLSESIHSRGQAILHASSRLDQSVRSALQVGADLSGPKLKELRSLIDGIVENLRSFEERRQGALEASVRQAAQHAAVCEAIEDLVRSIQFHDITRQQIEHVCDVLRQLISEARNGRKCSGQPADSRKVLRLQSSQLSSARLCFAAAIDRIQRDLEAIGARVQEMSDASQTLLGFSEHEQDSFFLRMEGCFTKILEAAGACTAAESEIETTAKELGQSITAMQEAVQEIRGIEIHIQRIAINATIRSVHIGAAGEALNVLAETMHRAALDANRNTEHAAEALDLMNAAVGSASGRAGVPAAPGAKTDSTDELEGMRNAVVELHSSSESSFQRVNQIAALSARLHAEILSAHEGLSAGTHFAEAIGRSCGELQRMGAQTHYETAETAPVEDLERFAKHYTMQSERDTHEAVVGSEPTAPTASIEESITGSGGDDDLGDNVELF